MKKNTILILSFFVLIFVSKAQTITSVANGNWSNPATWGTTPPMPGSDVIIAHQVVLDFDYGYYTGSIHVNASGQLSGNSPMRALAVYGGALTIGGSLNIARVALFGGTNINTGSIQSDSLYDATSLTNINGGTINAEQFMVSTGGNFINNGNVISIDFLNIATATNTGTINATDFMNCKSFLNASAGIITVGSNFLNSDSLTGGPAVFTNDGRVTVSNDWQNKDQMLGSGRYCVQNYTFNSGSMMGTFDFCDLTGGAVDLNTGTIDATITYCQYSCATEIKVDNNIFSFNFSPNPSNGLITVYNEGNVRNAILDIFNMMGEKVYSIPLNENYALVDLKSKAKGLYFYNIRSNFGINASGKLIIE